MTTQCIFCAIVARKAPANVVRAWDDAMAIVPLNPVTDGHVIVIPYEHVTDVLDSPEVSARVMRRAAQLAKGPCNFITSVGREATQSVFHLHLHIVPRKKDDGLALPWYSGKGNHNG
jgi:histidine triad (HIT) family protein